MKIFKYEIPIEDCFELKLPKRAIVLTIQTQDDVPKIWALVDPEAKKEIRYFIIIGTGYPIERNNLSYIGTFQLFNNRFVGHLFEIKKPLIAE